MLRRRRGVGLLGTMAVGGAAYAAGRSGANSRNAEQDQNEQIAQMQAQIDAQNRQQAQQAYAPPPQAAAPPPQAMPATPAPVTMDDKLAQLQRLSELKAAGVLTDEEVAVQKAKILGT